jgi:hypothetical protein
LLLWPADEEKFVKTDSATGVGSRLVSAPAIQTTVESEAATCDGAKVP